MGSRGPLTSPDSVRGQREPRAEAGGPAPTAATATPVRPDWLTAEADEMWDQVVSGLKAAGVPLQQIDSQAVGMFIWTIREARAGFRGG